jgi:hypothetical protein
MAEVLLGTRNGVRTVVDGALDRGHDLAGRDVRALARHRETWWAILDGTSVATRDPSGGWREVASTEPDLNCLFPIAGGAWCGTWDGALLRLLGDTFTRVTAFDAVDGHDAWHAVGSDHPYVRSISATADGSALLVNVHVGGIARSGNGGASWKPTIDIETDVHQVRAHPSDPKLVLAPAGYGLAISRDGGVAWEVTTDGMHAGYARAVAFTTDAALVSASDGPVGGTSALYRWDATETGPLTRITDGLPEWVDGNIDTGGLDARGETAAFADRGGNVYVSTDGGRSWSAVATDLGPITAVGVSS